MTQKFKIEFLSKFSRKCIKKKKKKVNKDNHNIINNSLIIYALLLERAKGKERGN